MAKRKIFDINPPADTKKPALRPALKEAPSFAEKLKSAAEEISLDKVKFKKPSIFNGGWRIKILIIFGIFIIFGGVLAYFAIKPQAEIAIWPQAEVMNFEVKVIAAAAAQKIDLAKNLIPGEVIEAESVASKKFPAQGTKMVEAKARGKIRIFNAYSTAPQTLIANTRFVSAEGKLFRLPQKAVVPGGHYDGGKLAPGTIDVDIVADQPGREYNIGASVFSIPGFAGTPKYTAFYGKSFESMKGGLKDEVPAVTPKDEANAEETLTKEAFAASKSALTAKILPGQILLDGAVRQEVVESAPIVEENQNLKEFDYRVKASSKTIIFKKSDIDDFTKEFIAAAITSQKEFQAESLIINYDLETINLDNNELVLNLKLSAKVYQAIDETKIKEEARGRNADAILNHIQENYTGAINSKVNFWPFWVNQAPEGIENIKIQLKLD